MPRKLPASFADAYATVSQDLMRRLGDSLAAEAGPPTTQEVEPITERQRVEAWDTPHPEATDAAMWQLAQQKLAEHRQAALAGQMKREDVVRAVAEDLTHFKYRARQPLYVQGAVGWAEQVKEAERLRRASHRRTGRAVPDAPRGDGDGTGPAPPGYPEEG